MAYGYIQWVSIMGGVSILENAISLHWRYNDHDGVSNHQPRVCLLNCLFSPRSKKTSKLRITGFVWGIHRDQLIPRTKGQ